MMHERFDQPAIAEEFVEGRELYVSRGRQWRRSRCPSDHRDGVRQAEDQAGGADRHPVGQVGRGLPRAEGHPERLRPAARGGGPRADRRVCHRAFRHSGSATTPGSTSGSAPDGEVWFLEANANPFISYGHDMANAADKAGHGLLRVYSAAGGRGDGALWQRRKAASGAHSGAALHLRLAGCTATGRTARTARARSSGATPSTSPARSATTAAGWCRQVLLVPLVRGGHPGRGVLLEKPLKAPRGFRMDARCDWGCGGGVQYPMSNCPWCGRKQSLERRGRVRGRLPPLRARCGRLDELLPLVRPGRHRPRSDSPGAHAGAAAAAGRHGYGTGDTGYCSGRDLGVDPRWPKIVEIEQRYVVGRRSRDEIPWTMLVGLITHELGHSFLYHHWDWTRTRRFSHAFGEVDKAYRGMDNSWVYFQRRSVAIAPRDFVSRTRRSIRRRTSRDVSVLRHPAGAAAGALRGVRPEAEGRDLYEKFLVLHGLYGRCGAGTGGRTTEKPQTQTQKPRFMRRLRPLRPMRTSVTIAALRPLMAMTLPPGWVQAPQRKRPGIGVRGSRRRSHM